MAYAKRTDSHGQTLKIGESQRKDGRYSYSWTNNRGERKVVYATSLLELRRKEKQLIQDLEDGLEPGAAERITVNQIWNKYIAQKKSLKVTTREGYIYTYDHFVRDSFGNMKISKVKYSHVKKFYNELLEDGISIATIDNVNTVLHPAFQMAVRDDLIRVNPTEGVMNEIKRDHAGWKKRRHALTVAQQKALVNFLDDNPVYEGWYPIIVTMLGTGMRVGEATGLRWEDVDFTNRVISVNHTLTYRPVDGVATFMVTEPKTQAGKRTIPLIDDVYDAMLREYRVQKVTGFNETEIDGYSGFIFTNADGSVLLPNVINGAINRIVRDYNKMETQKAAEEDREPVLLPHFSNHNLRHTFCTRLCENESNIKVIQSIMGHSDIQTTLDIYADCTADKKQEVMESLEGKIIVR